jgi:predicted nucleic acid-binding protein
VNPVLVDTSAWVEFLRRKESPAGRLVDALLAEDRLCTVAPIVAEVVSGARDRKEYETLRRSFGALRRLAEPEDLWDRIAEARYALARKGTQAAILDLWIAVAAAHAGVPLLTLDADFERIAKLVPVDRVVVA